MSTQIETLVDAYSRGHLSRRQLLSGLGALVAAAASSGPAVIAAQPSTFKSHGLNHIALRVTDVGRSRDFYVRHFGVEVLRQGPSNCFLGVGGNNFVALFRSDTSGMDHYCYTIDNYDPDAAVETLKAAGFSPRRTENRVYFKDPDGLEVQIASEWGDDPGARR